MRAEDCNPTPIKSGHFSKNSIKNLKHSLIISEDGGYFLLLNSIDDDEIKMLKENGLNEEYLVKVKSPSSGSESRKKLIIGKEFFSQVRIGLSLGSNETSNLLKLGEIVFCRKTVHLNSMNKITIKLNKIRRNLWENYSLVLLNKLVKSPQVYDMLLVDPMDGLEKQHCKGYIIGQFIPSLDGNKAFMKSNSPFKKNWLHQKAYFIDVFTGVSKLLNLGICLTDMKPSNTLYNSNKLEGFICLSGIVQKKTREDLAKNSFIKDSGNLL